MSNTPYIPFYTSEFLGGTSGLTAATKGVYITLLCLMYEAEGPLPQSWDTLARRCGCTLPAFKKAIDTLSDDGKVTVSDAGIWSEKCEKHITQRRERCDSAKSAAKRRWEKSKQKQRKDDAGAMQPQCQPEPEPDIREDTNVSSCPKSSKSEGFDAFWSVWPSKVSKQSAKRAWVKLSIESKREAYRAVSGGWFERWQARNADANPIHAATFLNQRRWEDDLSPQLMPINGGLYHDHRVIDGSKVPNRPQNRPDPALDQIARLAGIVEAPGNGGR